MEAGKAFVCGTITGLPRAGAVLQSRRMLAPASWGGWGRAPHAPFPGWDFVNPQLIPLGGLCRTACEAALCLQAPGVFSYPPKFSRISEGSLAGPAPHPE